MGQFGGAIVTYEYWSCDLVGHQMKRSDVGDERVSPGDFGEETVVTLELWPHVFVSFDNLLSS